MPVKEPPGGLHSRKACIPIACQHCSRQVPEARQDITSFGTNACRQEAQAYHLSSSFQLWVPVPAGRWISTGPSANCEVLRGPAIRPSTIMFAVADGLILSTSGSAKSSLHDEG